MKTLDAARFLDWLECASPGQVCVYHEGEELFATLCCDKGVSGTEARELRAAVQVAAGWVHEKRHPGMLSLPTLVMLRQSVEGGVWTYAAKRTAVAMPDGRSAKRRHQVGSSNGRRAA